MAAVERMLRARVSGQGDGSRARWLAPLVGPSLRRQQGQVFDRMRSMGVTRLRLVSVTERSQGTATTSTLTSTVRSSGPLSSPGQARARFAYRLSGFDTADRTFEVDLTLRLPSDAGGQPRVLAWTPHDRPQPWDLPHLTVSRSVSNLVLAGAPEVGADLLARAEAAQGQVSAVWGHSRPAVWVAPTTDAEAALLLGRDPADPAAWREVAAVTDGPLHAGRPAGADRIVVVPGAWRSLLGRGRDVVATHELTHVVVRGSTTGPVPLWLSEGFAEFVAYRTLQLPERDIVRPALEAARSNGLPNDLPTGSEFDPGAGGVPAAYGRSLLVARTLADRHGLAALVRFYRAVAEPSERSRSDGGDERDVVDPALVTALHTNRATLVRDWRARIERLLS